MNGQRISTKVPTPAPPNFRANFERGGWRLVERMYGCRTDQLLAWMVQTGCESRRKTAVVVPVDGGTVSA
jgi:hypothetical protein